MLAAQRIPLTLSSSTSERNAFFNRPLRNDVPNTVEAIRIVIGTIGETIVSVRPGRSDLTNRRRQKAKARESMWPARCQGRMTRGGLAWVHRASVLTATISRLSKLRGRDGATGARSCPSHLHSLLPLVDAERIAAFTLAAIGAAVRYSAARSETG